MYYVYVLQSLKNGRRYVGMTSRSVATRFAEHQRATSGWTRNQAPFELVHVEEYADKNAAQQRERFLKSGHGRELLNRLAAKQAVLPRT